MKPNPIRTTFLRACALVATLAALMPACADSYPDRVIKFVAPATPGVTADVVARVLADAMSKVLKQTIVVENKPGAEQQLGFEYVAKMAPADGYTVGVIGIDGQTLMPLVRSNLRFDPMKDLTLVAGLGEARYLLASPATAAPKNFKELVDAARAAPGKFNYGSSTPQVRLFTFSLVQDLGLDLVHVPFASGAPFLTALVGNTIDWGLIAEGTAAPVKSRLRFHAITGNSRSKANPEVPTFAELGHPRIYGPAYALAVRTGTPQAVIDKLSAAAAAALSSPDLKARAEKILFEARYEDAAAIARDANERHRFYQELAQRAGIKPE